MTSFANVQHRIVRDLRATITGSRSQRSESHEDINFCQRFGRRQHSRDVLGNFFLQFREHFLFERLRLIFGTQDFVFVLLQLRSDVSFLILQRLLANIFVRNFAPVSSRHFKVVPKNLVEADLQVWNSRPFAFLSLIRRDPLLTAFRQVSQLIQLSAESFPDHATVRHRDRRIVLDRVVYGGTHFRTEIDSFFQCLQAFRRSL